MKFKIDEDLPAEICADLRALGKEADTVLDGSLQGESDLVIVARARAEGRVLLTLDKGIANAMRYPKQLHSGVVLFRPGSSGRGAVFAFVRDRLPALIEIDLNGRICVVTATRIRLR